MVRAGHGTFRSVAARLEPSLIARRRLVSGGPGSRRSERGSKSAADEPRAPAWPPIGRLPPPASARAAQPATGLQDRRQPGSTCRTAPLERSDPLSARLTLSPGAPREQSPSDTAPSGATAASGGGAAAPGVWVRTWPGSARLGYGADRVESAFGAETGPGNDASGLAGASCGGALAAVNAAGSRRRGRGWQGRSGRQRIRRRPDAAENSVRLPC